MNKGPNFYPVLLILAFLFMPGCKEPTPETLNREEFKDPPSSVKLHTWWHWMDGAITREGITRDLEAMKKQGIAQATILNIGLFEGRDLGVERKVFKSPEWLELFRWALQEADRLGIRIGAHNCDGWSSSGGPWITPELSMKQFVWSKTIISGNENSPMVLSRPYENRDFYRDVAVVAYRTESTRNSFHKAAPEIKADDQDESSYLTDGCPVSGIQIRRGSRIDIAFQQPFLAEKILIHPRRSFMWGDMNDFVCRFVLQVSDDGKKFRELKEFEITGLNHTAVTEIPPTTSRYFRLTVPGFSDVDNWVPFLIGELELLREDESGLYDPMVPNHMVKTVSVKANRYADINTLVESDQGSSTELSGEIVDLTEYMDADGKLQWKVPEGNWVVIRFGYTSTGSGNGPATAEGRGLECDKMDTTALNVHFANYPKVLIDQAGSYAGNTFRFFLIDSWECGYQNWTGVFPSEFSTRRGYDIIPWIPVLCGENVKDQAEVEGFLYDFRKTIAELIEQNYYQHFRDLCHQNKIEMHAEVIYGGTGYPPLDVLKCNSYADLHMHEFWASHHPETSYPNYMPSERPEIVFPAQASVAYDLPVLGAEAYTAQAHYSETPWDLKRFGDRAYCSGVNQFILHSYVHQPDERVPGFTLNIWGSHFNRHNLYWDHISGWFDYHARVQYVLQKGTAKAQVLSYIGDQLPQSLEQSERYDLSGGYNVTFCNLDVLTNKLSVKDGRIVMHNRMTYDILTIPETPVMELATLKVIAGLVKQGAVLYGPMPRQVLSLRNRESGNAALHSLAQELWGQIDGVQTTENLYGKGKVFWGKSLQETLEYLMVSRSLETNEGGTSGFLFIHKKVDNLEVFFIANQEDNGRQEQLLFDATGIPEIWDPERGSINGIAIYAEEGDRIRMPVRFNPRQALFIVFREGKSSHITEVRYEGETIFPSPENRDLAVEIPEAYVSGDQIHTASTTGGQYTFIKDNDEKIDISLKPSETIQIEDFEGVIDYRADYEVELESSPVSSPGSWTLSDNPDQRYFSGTAIYRLKFSVPGDVIDSGDSLMISLGEVGTTGKVILNGKELGYVWQPDYRFNAGGLLVESNELVVEVANLYRNRIIGDYIQYGELKTIWTTAPVSMYLDRDKPLKPSGLMGPVQIIRIPKHIITE